MRGCAFRSQRQRDDQHVDAGEAGEFDQFVHCPEFRITGNHIRGPALVSIVEDPADADVVVRLMLDLPDQVLRGLPATDDDGSPFHGAVSRPVADRIGDECALRDEENPPARNHAPIQNRE